MTQENSQDENIKEEPSSDKKSLSKESISPFRRALSYPKFIFLILIVMCSTGIWGYYKLFPIEIFSNRKKDILPISTKTTDNSLASSKIVIEEKTPQIIDHKENLVPEKDYNFKPVQTAAYRHYLLELNRLVIKFFQDLPFTEEISQILALNLPDEVKIILNTLSDYNKEYLKNNAKENNLVFPQHFRILKKFLLIEKIDPSNKLKESLKTKIIDDLDILMDYFYSSDLQQKFIDELLEK